MEDVKDKVKEDYLNGMKYKDLEKKYKTSINTIKSWIKRYGWSEEKRNRGAPKKEKGCTQKGNKKDKSSSKKELIEYEVKDVLENTELTDKQRLFCIYYIEEFNATKAYRKAYNCDYSTAMVEGSKCLRKPKIKTEIDRLTEEVLEEKEVNSKILSKRLFQRYIDIAFADITDYVDFGNEKVEGEFGLYTRSYINLKNSFEVNGTVISEVSQSKDGIKVKLYDKMKAMEFLSKHIGLLDVITKDKLEKEKAKLNIDKERLELEKYKTLGDEEGSNNEAIQSFIKATSMSDEELEELFSDEEGEEDGTT